MTVKPLRKSVLNDFAVLRVAGIVDWVVFLSCSGMLLTHGLNLIGSNFSVLVVFNSDGDMALFLPTFYVPVCLSRLFQRKAPVDDRFYLPRFDKLFDGK